MTTTPTSGAAIQRFEVVDCIDDKHVPAVIPKPHGPWVRYEDHIAALAAGQATAAQADSVQEDAALWHWLAEYLVGTRTDLDDEIVASETVNDLRKLVKAAIKQGESNDR